MKKIILSLMVIFGVSSVNAEDAKKMDGKAAAHKASDMVVVETIERKKYVLKKEGDNFRVVHSENKKPFMEIAHMMDAPKDPKAFEGKIKKVLNDHRAKDGTEKAATLYGGAAGRMQRQVDKGISDALSFLSPITSATSDAVSTFGPLAALFL